MDNRTNNLDNRWKIAISVCILFHLLGVLAEPLFFFTRGNSPSPMAGPLRRWMAPYVEFAYLNHGYFFFAPNPGPGHLMDCQLQSSDGKSSRIRLPDRQAQWPRLFYHRHLMLAEFLHQLHVPPVTAADVANTPDPTMLEAMRADRAQFEMVRDSMIKHLKSRYGATEASIIRLEHRLPSSAEIFDEKIPLSDERLYAILPDAPLPPVTNAQQRLPLTPVEPLDREVLNPEQTAKGKPE